MVKKKKKEEESYGGARSGAGRKPIDPSKKRRNQVSAWMTDDEIKNLTDVLADSGYPHETQGKAVATLLRDLLAGEARIVR